MEKTNLSNPLHFKQPSNYLEPSMVQVTLKGKGIKNQLWSPIRSCRQRSNSTFENGGATKCIHQELQFHFVLNGSYTYTVLEKYVFLPLLKYYGLTEKHPGRSHPQEMGLSLVVPKLCSQTLPVRSKSHEFQQLH